MPGGSSPGTTACSGNTSVVIAAIAMGTGTGYGQWHLIDPGLPPDGSDAPDGDADPDDADPDGELAPSDDNESA